MTAFLFTILFILIALAFILIILLFYRLQAVKDVEKKQNQMLTDTETLISTYLLEMKEENELFLNKLSKTVHDKTDKSVTTKYEETASDSNNEQLAIMTSFDYTEHVDASSFLPDYKQQNVSNAVVEKVKKPKDNIHNSDEIYMQSLAAQVQLLIKQGKTHDEIAKILNKGKTEIELLLKFRQK
ncbi:hypothetical protein EJF36_09300 [Bacillus sp. HMF5848]|uniref:hypothetical protein n=1 Tax=Bacillus sp. HMF5848 TaxID=2495421 RepID=UPI000F793911|nr:hypothetical protein [Bacillus sp. HMF5848]RSK27055.1 hypothetical protein EJF36_09300 [Bacillus sp. HMF5848]